MPHVEILTLNLNRMRRKKAVREAVVRINYSMGPLLIVLNRS